MVVAGVAPQLLGDLLERAGDRAAGGHRAGERRELELASARCDHPSIKRDIQARLLLRHCFTLTDNNYVGKVHQHNN